MPRGISPRHALCRHAHLAERASVLLCLFPSKNTPQNTEEEREIKRIFFFLVVCFLVENLQTEPLWFSEHLIPARRGGLCLSQVPMRFINFEKLPQSLGVFAPLVTDGKVERNS